MAGYLIRVLFFSCFIRLEYGVALCAWMLEQLQHLIWWNTGNQSYTIGTVGLNHAHETIEYDYYYYYYYTEWKNNICSYKFILFENS
jgi:hypothetical protein